jgi:hypothetical protein
MYAQRFSAGGVDLSPGVNGTIADSLTFAPSRQAPEPPAAVGATSSSIGGTAPHLTIVGMIGLLVAIWLFQKAGHLSGNVIFLNVINFFIIGLTAGTGILMAKWLFNRVPVPNITEAINSI